ATGTITVSTPGVINQTGGVIVTTGGLSLTYTGSATFTSIGNSAPSLSVPAGLIVQVDGSFTTTSPITVDGTLRGKGAVGNVMVSATGTIAPGTSPGQLTTGNVAMSAMSKFEIELNGTTPGTSYDQLKVIGTVDLGNADLVGSLTFVPPSGSKYTIIDN